MDKIQRAAPTFPELPLINGRRMEKAIVGTRPSGGITGDKIKEVMKQVFRAACPDFANEPGKKILWLTDAGPGRLDEDFVKWMHPTYPSPSCLRLAVNFPSFSPLARELTPSLFLP
jgi:hypothetical protein